ncbi:hypothetical protein ABZT17_21265 [Streptomyces sp. NPDC005648]|uniref:hypothetical protein n=1 Tax=Streptomyces sp. NPDC005648 TaxID=3157044 RepID=UPI0033AFED41
MRVDFLRAAGPAGATPDAAVIVPDAMMGFAVNYGNSFHLREQLLYKIRSASKGHQVAFVVGSGLTRETVPGVSEYVAMMRKSLESEPWLSARFDEEITGPTWTEKYQQAAAFISHVKDQDHLNQIIRKGVIRACRDVDSMPEDEIDELVKDESLLRLLEKEGTWNLGIGVEAFGLLLTLIPPEKRGPVLTTNFDPLIEVSIRSAGARPAVQWMVEDGSISDFDSDDAIDVIHMHGYWRRGGTLHTQSQLGRDRMELDGSIRERLRNKYVVVCAYGGWRDAFTKSIMGRLRERNCLGMEVSWAWHMQAHELSSLNGIGKELQQIHCVAQFVGVDADLLFLEVLTKL